MNVSRRKPLVSVLGDAKIEVGQAAYLLAKDVGRLLVEAGFRVATGGLGGVMNAAMEGAHEAVGYRDGDTIAILPGNDPASASAYADIVIATGLGLGRNLILANSDAVIAIGGGAGTLSEIALAWQLRRLIIALDAGGWSARVAGLQIDHRTRRVDDGADTVLRASTAEDAVALVRANLRHYPRRLETV